MKINNKKLAVGTLIGTVGCVFLYKKLHIDRIVYIFEEYFDNDDPKSKK